jgi:hypothetical protein
LAEGDGGPEEMDSPKFMPLTTMASETLSVIVAILIGYFGVYY